MSAWQVENRWDSSYAARFRDSVLAGVQRYTAHKATFTCEDLPLQLIIDFASSHRLPLKIKNGSRSRGYVPSDYDSLTDYRVAVLSSTGARDLLLDGNTVAVGSDVAGRDRDLDFAQVGDMIVLDYGKHGHVQLVTRVSPTVIDIAQGNFPDPGWHCSGGNKNDPSDRCYLGIRIQQYSYALRDGHWRYTKPGGDELVIQTRRGKVRRWNFTGWNPQPTPKRLPEALGAPGRRW